MRTPNRLCLSHSHLLSERSMPSKLPGPSDFIFSSTLGLRMENFISCIGSRWDYMTINELLLILELAPIDLSLLLSRRVDSWTCGCTWTAILGARRFLRLPQWPSLLAPRFHSCSFCGTIATSTSTPFTMKPDMSILRYYQIGINSSFFEWASNPRLICWVAMSQEAQISGGLITVVRNLNVRRWRFLPSPSMLEPATNGPQVTASSKSNGSGAPVNS